MRRAAFLDSDWLTASLVLSGAAATACVMLSFHGGLAICLAAALALLLISLTRFDLTNLTIAVLVSQPVIGFVKRAIFLLGPQPTSVYQAIQGVSTLLLLLALAGALMRLNWSSLPRSGKILAAYLALAALTTLLVPGPSWYARGVATLTRVLPPAAFYVGLAIGVAGLLRVGRVALVLVFLSVAYGLFQFFHGPSAIEHTWAMQMKESSIQAAKVYAHIAGQRFIGDAPEFRPFSFYSDPLHWGLFLVSSFLMLLLLRAHKWLGKTALRCGVAGVVCGLVLTLSRSTSAGLLVMLGTLILLRRRVIQRPWALIALIVMSFATVIEGGTFLIDRFGGTALPDNVVLRRLLTVGTLGDRVHAGETLRSVAADNWMIGRGYGQSWSLAGKLGNSGVDAAMVSHNFVVDVVLYVGVPGFLILAFFYLQWLRESIDAVQKPKTSADLEVTRLVVAFSVGFISIGLFSGDNFMTFEFFLILGALAGSLGSPRRMLHVQQA